VFALLSPGLVAVVLAMVSQRSLAGLTRQRIAWWPLGFASFGAEFAISSTPLGEQPFIVAWGSAVWLVALIAMVTMLARNAWLRSSAARWAWGVAALGVFVNLVVVLANDGHMPQSQEARIAAGASPERVAGFTSDPGWRNVMPMTPQTRLAWLGDVLPEPAWLPLRNVMSLGDLLLAGGLATVIYLATTPGAERVSTQPRLETSDDQLRTRKLPLLRII
jgi:Family of unknown function (DUF5317)